MSDERIAAAAKAIKETWWANEFLQGVSPAEAGECEQFAEVALAAADEMSDAERTEFERLNDDLAATRTVLHQLLDAADRGGYGVMPSRFADALERARALVSESLSPPDPKEPTA